MKKVLMVLIVMIVSLGLFAADFAGIINVALNYSYRDGRNMGGMSVDNFGLVGDCPVGYYIGADADFSFKDVKDSSITLIAAPYYSYKLENVPMTIDVALGVGASADVDKHFGLGLAGYIGAAYHLKSDKTAFLIGTKLGYDMLSVELHGGSCSYKGEFFVTPLIGGGFCY